MKTRFLVLAATVAGTVGLVAGPAAAAPGGNGYGKAIQECTNMSYGQLKNSVWESGHAGPPAAGAMWTAMHVCPSGE